MIMHGMKRREVLLTAAAALAALLTGCGTSGKPLPLPEGDRVPVNAWGDRKTREAARRNNRADEGRAE